MDSLSFAVSVRPPQPLRPPAPHLGSHAMGIASTAQRAVSNAAAAGCHGVATRFRDAQPPVCDADFVGAGANSTRFIELNSARPLQLRNTSRRAADEPDEGGEMESSDMSFLQSLIQKQREATELVYALKTGTQKFSMMFLKAIGLPGYRDALEAGVDLVDVLANSSALKLLGDLVGGLGFSSSKGAASLLCSGGLGYIVHRSVVQHYSVLSPLQQTMKRLSVGEIETLTIHSLGQGRMHFPFWVYDAVVEAYQKGLCSRIGVSHPNADVKSVQQARQDGPGAREPKCSTTVIAPYMKYVKAVQLVKDCRAEGLQVFATEVLGPDELASGRYTAANPTGGFFSVLLSFQVQVRRHRLRPLHDALEEVARGLRSRCEKPNIDTTQVALQWVVSKGASPLCDVTTSTNAKAVAGCTGSEGGWKLTPEEEARLDEAADEVAKTRRRYMRTKSNFCRTVCWQRQVVRASSRMRLQKEFPFKM
ncbi:unnamed protein product [Symbiodinium pilosum]|uniref:NADP-dependent oxidoreductase domain-containing protein n=1 Tax=Symbiodinium pilosum TaxID=2952 RepID=A0A812WVA7_SYMPI|nr:unnamed protein product [Symbiodinium pilosum]